MTAIVAPTLAAEEAAPEPVRDGSRDGCPVCGRRRPSARAQSCSAACRQRGYRWRQAAGQLPETSALERELRRLRQLAAQTIHGCGSCDVRQLGTQRCEECNRFGQRLGLGGLCPHCDEPILLAELLEQEVADR